MKQTKTSAMSVRMLSISALFTALVAVGAFIRIPVPMWPFTLQTLFTILAGLLLGSRYGFLSIAAYVVLGLVGLPIFTGGGGPQYIFQPTFGCLIGFAVGAGVSGWIVEHARGHRLSVYVGAMLANLAVVYVLGMAWFWVIKAFYLQDPIGVWTLFLTCFAPTIGVDIVKGLLAVVLAMRLRPVLLQYNGVSRPQDVAE